MSAREIFELLGYTFGICKNGNYLYDKPRQLENRHQVEFFIKSKTYHIVGTQRFSINMELNKAIQKQIEELGWN